MVGIRREKEAYIAMTSAKATLAVLAKDTGFMSFRLRKVIDEIQTIAATLTAPSRQPGNESIAKFKLH